MYVLYLGLRHQETSLEVLEQVHFKEEDIQLALTALKREKSVLEAAILSTCNRTELYLVVDQLHTGRYYGKQFLARWFDLDLALLETHLQILEDLSAVHQLLRVATGLESRILGEYQILNQVKQAFFLAQETGTSGVILNELFRRVLTFAKRMHHQYRINERPLSISLTAMQLLEFLKPSAQTILIIGLGEIGQLLVKYALKRPFTTVRLLNRTLSKMEPYQRDPRVQIYSWEQMKEALFGVDVVFSAAATGQRYLNREIVASTSLVFDLCLPRTCETGIGERLLTIEDIQGRLDEHYEKRQEIAMGIAQEVEAEVLYFNQWRQQLGIIPLIQEIREYALGIQEASFASLERKLPELTDRQRKVIQKHMKGISNQLIKNSILQLKERSIGDQASHDIAVIRSVFGFSEEEL
ncbi:glutamyl-tRNA reductase [Streptococcus danieliae]|uniref:Glutamyl-tRNA reductase n=1 Tax=Streptococcus danieliae TaxID=747656 RepID=A0A7Z0M4B5_9STRE|nr:glutamyl-tRNA reductase [Streptococcus danieliae]MBF0698455.1 glutamyl-tRNA reductase [Streptococcus danieliae]NYS95632.1 glutamyl-tRNA reductase [Streptococcus danieliae]